MTRNFFNKINSSVIPTKGGISEIVDRSIEIIQIESQKDKRLKNTIIKDPRAVNNAICSNICVVGARRWIKKKKIEQKKIEQSLKNNIHQFSRISYRQ